MHGRPRKAVAAAVPAQHAVVGTAVVLLVENQVMKSWPAVLGDRVQLKDTQVSNFKIEGPRMDALLKEREEQVTSERNAAASAERSCQRREKRLKDELEVAPGQHGSK